MRREVIVEAGTAVTATRTASIGRSTASRSSSTDPRPLAMRKLVMAASHSASVANSARGGYSRSRAASRSRKAAYSVTCQLNSSPSSASRTSEPSASAADVVESVTGSDRRGIALLWLTALFEQAWRRARLPGHEQRWFRDHIHGPLLLNTAPWHHAPRFIILMRASQGANQPKG